MESKKIGIIGGGFSGLGVAYRLKGYDVTIIESDNILGGLASWIEDPEWEWPIEKFVHHWFTTDHWVMQMMKEIGLEKKLIKRDTKSSVYYNGKVAELDSPVSLLRFPFLSIPERLRMAFILAWLRFDKSYLKYEKTTAYNFIRKSMGSAVFKVVWEPLLVGKFGKDAKRVNAAWFWGRIHPRTKSLAYLEGGFKEFVDKVVENIKNNDTKIILNTKVDKIKRKGNKFIVRAKRKEWKFDHLVLAVPLQVALKLYDFPEEYKKRFKPLKSIGAQYFVLELEKSLLNGIYWLNINDKRFPFVVVVEHTSLIDKKYYGDKHMVWVGKYLDYDDPLWKLSEEELIKKIIPCLKKINPDFKKEWIRKKYFIRVRDAQPVLGTGYSKKIPKIETPAKNLYMANMNQIYPWDRGTNNAIGLGFRVAKKIKKKIK